MKQKPFFSIVIPTFNRAEKLQFALHCLLRQSFQDFEIIISDNWSTDNTKDVIHNTRDARVHYVKCRYPTMYSQNLQNAVNHAKGRYVFIHSDDDVLPDKDSLRSIRRKALACQAGFIRVNYVCVSPDKKRLFSFEALPYRMKDFAIPAEAASDDIISFLSKSDVNFITGLLYRNTVPKTIRMIRSEHAPWIAILLYVIKKYGGYFFSSPHVVASWSTWRNRQDGLHPVYSMHNGTLEAEYYFDVVRKEMSAEAYASHVHRECMRNYVRIFPLIKTLIGNRQLIILSRKIRMMDPSMVRYPMFWINLWVALLFPAFLVRIMRNILRSLFMRYTSIEQSATRLTTYRALEREYLKTHAESIGDAGRFFL